MPERCDYQKIIAVRRGRENVERRRDIICDQIPASRPSEDEGGTEVTRLNVPTERRRMCPTNVGEEVLRLF